METEIINNIDNPIILEKLYRSDKIRFKNSFSVCYAEIQNNPIAQVWNERLATSKDDLFLGNKNEIFFGLMAAFISGIIAKIPSIIGIEYDLFLSKNIGFIVFPMVSIYFVWKQKLSFKKYLFLIFIFIATAFYINSLPNNEKSATIILAGIHLPLFLWAVLGYAFIGGDLKNSQKKIAYLKFNGNFIIMSALLILSSVLFSAVTINLFMLLGVNIEKFYTEQIAVWGLSAIPLLSTYLVQYNPLLVNKISPTIARIFTPIVFITLLIFLATLVYTGKNIYNDRDFLLLFNALLIGVMAIIIFSFTEVTQQVKSKISLFILFGLSVLAIIANGIALSAIAFRLTEFGISPNRLAILGANFLMFIHLSIVSYTLFMRIRNKANMQDIENKIVLLMPLYAFWAAFVTFVMPFLFNFK